MQTSRNGRSALAREEAVILVGYPDSRRIPTDGVGHTAAAGGHAPVVGEKITLAAAMATFAQDLGRFEERVASLVTVPLAQNEFDALVSFDFNTGGLRFKSARTGKLTDSALLKAVNGRKGAAAIEAGFMGWTRAGTNPVALKGRRQREFAMFARGDYGQVATVPVSEVWPPHYKPMALPADEPETATLDETADAQAQLPAPAAPPVAPMDYDPETDGPATAEPPPPLMQSKTLIGSATSAISSGGFGYTLSQIFQNPNAPWILGIAGGLLLIGGLALVIVFRERIAKRVELGI